jgi:XTP/dITP diphosphohydrolase
LTESRLLLATTNPGKVREIRRALKGLSFRGQPLRVVGVTDVFPGLSYRESGKTFSANARSKSLFYSREWDGPTLAEDSGLEIDALAGAPGVRSARFSAPNASDEKNNRKVLRLLRKVPAGARKARFVCVMVLARKGRVVGKFRGGVRGTIGLEPRGASGFGYDPLFYYSPLRKTFGELAPDIKNTVSHRGRAVRKLRAFLEAQKKAPSGDAPDRAAAKR